MPTAPTRPAAATGAPIAGVAAPENIGAAGTVDAAGTIFEDGTHVLDTGDDAGLVNVVEEVTKLFEELLRVETGATDVLLLYHPQAELLDTGEADGVELAPQAPNTVEDVVLE